MDQVFQSKNRVAEWIRKQDPYKRLTSDQKTHRVEVNGLKKIIHENRSELTS